MLGVDRGPGTVRAEMTLATYTFRPEGATPPAKPGAPPTAAAPPAGAAPPAPAPPAPPAPGGATR